MPPVVRLRESVEWGMPASVMRLPSWYLACWYLLTLVELVGGVFGLAAGRNRLRHAPRLVCAWLFLAGVSGVCQDLMRRLDPQFTQLVPQLWYPGSGALGLWIVAAILPNRWGRSAFRYLAVAYVVVIASVLLSYETMGDYSRIAGVLHGLTLLIAGCVVLYHRVRVGRRELYLDPGFHFGVGFLLVGAPGAMVALAGRELGQNIPALLQLFSTRLLLMLVAVVLMVNGLRLRVGEIEKCI